MSDRRLFGTDGIRGVAGHSPLTPKDVLALGRCAGQVLREETGKPNSRVLIVRDTRWSGESLLNHLSQGLRENGVDVFDAGVLSTPSVACLVQAHRFDSGVVISASHNPPKFNGIKFFTSHGRKWPNAWERSVEKKFFARKGAASRPLAGSRIFAANLAEDYEDFLIGSLGRQIDFSGLRLALDCSHGANALVGPELFSRLGATVYAIGTKPNGRNINVGCGSQNTGPLAALVRAKRCHMGIAFDGDGDRVIMIDEKGGHVDGDHIIALLARSLKKQRRLKNNIAVITVMANLGLKKALRKIGVRTVEVAVGDRFVSEAMKKHQAVLGGEQSGHIILGEFLPTGDGLLTALHTVAFMRAERKPLSALVGWMRKYPQVLHNMSVKERIPLPQLNGVSAKIKRIEKTLGSDGRVLVRYSGTEPLLRIMLEGPDKKALEGFAGEIAESVRLAAR
jgi:phosphoglucosamine mutase